MKKNKFNEVIDDAITNIRSMLDASAIFGKPYVTDSGSTVIPISKISVGFLSCGGEYGEVKFLHSTDFPNMGASGGVVSLKPSGFLVEKNGKLKYVHCPTDKYEVAVESIMDLVKSINGKNSNT